MAQKAKKVFHLPVIAVVKNRKGQVLLIQRNNPKSTHSHLKWALPGGGIEFGEHPTETVVREVREETGIEITVKADALFIENHVFEDHGIHVLCLCYPAYYKSGIVDTSKDKGTRQAKWFYPDEVDFKNYLPKTKEIVERGLVELKPGHDKRKKIK
ncbi:MAG: NUDIX hydrolase [Candidatus Levyibacteriota bacterium]